jgi:hypothetical protein
LSKNPQLRKRLENARKELEADEEAKEGRAKAFGIDVLVKAFLK